jgi:hypothetical protein
MCVPVKNVMTRQPPLFPLPFPANRTLRAPPRSLNHLACCRVGCNPGNDGKPFRVA